MRWTMTFDEFRKLTVEEQDKVTLGEFKELLKEVGTKGDPIHCKQQAEKNCIALGYAPLWCISFCPPTWWT